MNDALISARKELGLTSGEAAKKIGISQGMLSMLENKQRSGTDKTKIKVASFYQKTVSDLFYSN